MPDTTVGGQAAKNRNPPVGVQQDLHTTNKPALYGGYSLIG
ncbi:hypothetical protein [uncultured Methanobrevibacter sp.]|nr:hypothetical protein [uncultured Methanobrevibacter sp.]